MALRGLAGDAVVLACALVLGACGTDVDLGGASDTDAGTVVLDAGHPGPECAPCAAASECLSGTCGQFAGDLFCATACSTGADCASDETCSSVTTTAGATVKACVPQSGACTPAAPPAAPDGGVLETCGDLNGPTVTSQCKACGKYSNDCQPNGCYGGYWCNEPERDCTPPPKSCP